MAGNWPEIGRKVKLTKNLFIYIHHDQLIDSDIAADWLPSAPFPLDSVTVSRPGAQGLSYRMEILSRCTVEDM